MGRARKCNIGVLLGAVLISLGPSGCGGSTERQTSEPSNPIPNILALSPVSSTPGGPDFTLTVNGSNFVSDARIRWDGSDRPTTFVSSSQLTASISGSDLVTPGTVAVTVFNPQPGGGISQPLTFAIEPNAANLWHIFT